MFDEHESDEKIIAVCQNDPSMNGYKDISELPKHYFDEITHFFNVYKTLEGKETVVTEVLGREAAENIIQESIDAYTRLLLK
jgi:inorganic pyrophosphatase